MSTFQSGLYSWFGFPKAGKRLQDEIPSEGFDVSESFLRFYYIGSDVRTIISLWLNLSFRTDLSGSWKISKINLVTIILMRCVEQPESLLY